MDRIEPIEALFNDLSPNEIATSKNIITIRVPDKKFFSSLANLSWYLAGYAPPPIKSQKGGILLPGPSDTLMIDASFDYEDKASYKDSEISIDKDESSFLRTYITIEFVNSATVSDVNNILKTIHGKIMTMQEDSVYLGVLIPDPVTNEKLEALLQKIRKMPKIKSAEKVRLPGIDLGN